MLAAVNPDDEIEMTYRRSHCWVVAEDWRLVKATEEDEEEYDDYWSPDRYEMENGVSPYSNDYVGGQDVPQSPAFNGYGDQQAAEDCRGMQLGDGSYSAEYVNQQGQQTSPPGTIKSQQSAPAWAQEARSAGYYGQPQYQPQQQQQPPYGYQQHHQMRSVSGTSQMSYGSHSRMSSRQSGYISSRSSSLPTTPHQVNSDPSQQPQIKPFQLQPFEFDLKPLEVTKSSSPTQSPSLELKTGSPIISPMSPMSPISPMSVGARMEPPRLSPTQSSRGSASPPNRSPLTGPQSPMGANPTAGSLVSPTTQSPVSMSPMLSPQDSPQQSPRQSRNIGVAMTDHESVMGNAF